MRSLRLLLLCSLVGLAGCGDGTGDDPANGGGAARCGDGVRQGAEECDDGNVLGFDGCGPSCMVEFCGDGVAQLDEECDDGELMANEADLCRPGCIAPRCGDAIVDEFEACDDGNNEDGDGCSADCAVRVCRLGEDIATLAEAAEFGQCAPILVPAGTFVGGAVFRRNQTIIGEGAGSSVLDGGGTEQVIRVEFGARVELQGLTIRNGRAEQGGAIWNGGELFGTDLTVADSVAVGPDDLAGEGGGIYSRGPIELVDSLVIGNQSLGDGDDPVRGGGLYLLNTTAALRDCVVRDNAADATGTTVADGGGIYLNRGTLTLQEATRIEANLARSESGLAGGGGLATARGTVVAEAGTVIDENRVITGEQGVGGGIAADRATIEATGLLLSGNTIEASVMFGAGAHLIASDVTLGPDTTISANRLSRDETPELARGAGLYLEEGPASLQGVTIEGNEITHSGEGAGMYIIATRNDETLVQGTDVLIRNNTIAPTDVGRTTARGAGVYVRSGEATAHASLECEDCLVTGNAIRVNTVGDAYASGGGVYAEAVFGEATTDVLFRRGAIEGNTIEAIGDTASAQGGGLHVASTDDRAVTTVTLDRVRLAGNVVDANGEEDAEAEGAGAFVYAADGEAASRVVTVNTSVDANAASATGAAGLPATSVRAWGGAMAVYATSGGDSRAQLFHTTVAGNATSATDGTASGGAFHLYPVTDDAHTVVELGGTIIAGNDAAVGPVCHVQTGADGLALTATSIVDDLSSCLADETGAPLVVGDPLITAGDDGVPVPGAGSPAIDGGEAACVGPDLAPLTADLRGNPRPAGVACDLGAVEVR